MAKKAVITPLELTFKSIAQVFPGEFKQYRKAFLELAQGIKKINDGEFVGTAVVVVSKDIRGYFTGLVELQG